MLGAGRELSKLSHSVSKEKKKKKKLNELLQLRTILRGAAGVDQRCVVPHAQAQGSGTDAPGEPCERNPKAGISMAAVVERQIRAPAPPGCSHVGKGGESGRVRSDGGDVWNPGGGLGIDRPEDNLGTCGQKCLRSDHWDVAHN